MVRRALVKSRRAKQNHPVMGAEPNEIAWRLRRANLFETAAFLLVLVPWMGFATIGARPQDLSFSTVAIIIMVHDVALAVLALYLVWRNGEGVGAIGWKRQGAGREALIGVALFVPMLIAIGLIEALLRTAGFAEPIRPPSYLLPQTNADYVVAFLLLAVVAVAEETVFRGYLLRRFTQATGSRWLAVVLSSAIFALGHVYQGPLGAVAVGVIGIVFALVYLKRGSLVAPIAMHFIQDFIGLIIVPRLLAG